MSLDALRETSKQAGMTHHECPDGDTCIIHRANDIRRMLDRYELNSEDETNLLSILIAEASLRLASPALQQAYLKMLLQHISDITVMLIVQAGKIDQRTVN